jgi:hypothetical protein
MKSGRRLLWRLSALFFLGFASAQDNSFELYLENDCRGTVAHHPVAVLKNQSSSSCNPINFNAKAVKLVATEKCVLAIYVDSKCFDAIGVHTDGKSSCISLSERETYFSTLECWV